MNIAIKNKAKYVERVKYVIEFLNNHPYTKEIHFEEYKNQKIYDKILVYGSPTDSDEFFIPKQSYVFENKDHRKLVANEYSMGDQKLFSVEPKSKPIQSFFSDFEYAFDWIETIFFHITRYEEHDCNDKERDEWDAMKEENQFLVKNKLQLRPQVDILVLCVLNTLDIVVDKTPSSICITHDIDHLYKYNNPWNLIKTLAKNLIYYKSFKRLGQVLTNYKQGNEPYMNYSQLLVDLSIEKKIYFLMSDIHKYDANVKPKKGDLLKFINHALLQNYAIGIHPSYTSWQNEKLILSEIRELESFVDFKISISRQHYLHFHFPQTIHALIAAGIKEDSSLGFNYHYGFRCGTGFKYFLYDFESESCSSLTEDPPIIMDSTLLQIFKFNERKAYSALTDFLEINTNNTRINCIFHNSAFDHFNDMNIDLSRFYKKILDFAKRNL